MHPTRNDLSEKARAEVAALLNRHLATALDLHMQSKQAHWNVKGHHFFQLRTSLRDFAISVAVGNDGRVRHLAGDGIKPRLHIVEPLRKLHGGFRGVGALRDHQLAALRGFQLRCRVRVRV